MPSLGTGAPKPSGLLQNSVTPLYPQRSLPLSFPYLPRNRRKEKGGSKEGRGEERRREGREGGMKVGRGGRRGGGREEGGR